MKPELAKLIRQMWAHKLTDNAKYDFQPIQAVAGMKLADEYADDESVINIAAALYLALHMDNTQNGYLDTYPHEMLLEKYNELYEDEDESDEDADE